MNWKKKKSEKPDSHSYQKTGQQDKIFFFKEKIYMQLFYVLLSQTRLLKHYLFI